MLNISILNSFPEDRRKIGRSLPAFGRKPKIKVISSPSNDISTSSRFNSIINCRLRNT